ncbi:hypothetical protein FNH48_18125 [Salmonella enterica subsp. salamae]|nr:hypothetical protein [Salmonella enterica subsp. salamae]
MRLYNFTSITTDRVFIDDVICEDDLRNIIKSIDIVASTRQKACLQLLNYRKKNIQYRLKARKELSQHVKSLRQRVRNNNEKKFNNEIRNTINWMIDIQNVERLLLHDVMCKAHISLTQVLPTLISSKLDWENLLSDMIRHELEDNHITGAIRITCSPALKLNCILRNESKNFHIIHDSSFPVNKLIIENQYVRITLDPLKQIDMLLDIFKLTYLNLIEEGQECHNYQ